MSAVEGVVVENEVSELEAAREIRRMRAAAVQAAVAAGRGDLDGDVALVVTELVTNAMLHAGGTTGVVVRPGGGGVVIEVSDASPVPPVFARESDDDLTGRGMRIVSRLSARWGVHPTESGKTIWAEVTGATTPVDSSLSGADLLAMWDDQLDATDGADRFRIVLGNVPTDLLLEAKAHVENLVREFALATTGAETGTTAEVSPHLQSLLDALDAFAEARMFIKRQALEAARQGAPTTVLVLELPLTAADAAERYLQALDEVDAYSRAARLLTLETPPQHRVFRQWYVGQLVALLRAASAGAELPEPQRFEQRLLAELDVLAAAQRSSERAARLYSVSSALAAAETPDDVAAVVLNEGVAALRASGGGVLLLTAEDRLALRGAVGYDDALVSRLRAESRDAELPAAFAMRTGESVWLESRAERDARFPDLAGLEAATVSLCAVPLEVQNRRLGAVRFSFTEARLFDEDERQFVQALAAQTAQALERTQLQEARIDVSRRLQRSLLPPDLPLIPNLEVAAVYHPFGDGVEVGGDFYDVWQVGSDQWAVAIGDASGTGPEAAALTALVRHTLHALTLHDPMPEHVVRTLNDALTTAMVGGEDRFCTAVFGMITPRHDGSVSVTLAGGGHPPVFVRRAAGGVEPIYVGGSLLGLLAETDVASVTIELQLGDALVLLTDGVLEARRAGEQFDVHGVCKVLSGSEATSAVRVVEALESAVLTHTGGTLSDDMAVVAAWCRP